MLDAYLDPLRNFTRVDGRTSPSRFWVFAIVNAAITVVIFQLDMARGWTFASGGFGYVSTAFWVAMLVPTTTAAVRRLHDSGLEGALLAVVLIPFVGGLIACVLLLRSTQRGPNRYGPDPSGWAPAIPAADGSLPQVESGRGSTVRCPWCGKSNPAGRQTCQWCHRQYSDGHV